MGLLQDYNSPLGVDPAEPVLVSGIGTAGTPTGGVLSVQGVPGGTPIPLSFPGGTTIGVTQSTSPWVVSGTVTANQGTPALASSPWPIAIAVGGVTVDPRMDSDLAASLTGIMNALPAVSITVLGRRSNGWSSTSLYGDVCDYLDTSQANMNTPTSGQTLYLVSTSANDTAAGTGIQTVRIVYLDVNGVQQVRTDTLNGLTPVSIGSGYTFIQWMESATVGSGGVASGSVTISSTNGAATVATTFEQISQNSGRSQSARYKIPAGKNGYAHSWSAGAVGTTIDFKLRADCFSDDGRVLSPGAFHAQDSMYASANVRLSDEHLHWKKYPSGCVVKVSGIPGNAPSGNRADASFHLLLVG